jgi:predicted small lipoprotein YifL
MKNRLLSTLVFLSLLIGAVFLLSGCGHLGSFFFPEAPDRDAKVEWRKTLKMNINGETHFGMVKVQESKKYIIKIYPFDDHIDRVQWRTCHRDGFADKAVESSFWPWSKKNKFYQLDFSPNQIELNRACGLRIESLTKKHTVMEFGLILFHDIRPEVSLGAGLACNGEFYAREGVAECQGAVGSTQEIYFSEKVYQDESENRRCPPLKEIEDGVFSYKVPRGECVYPLKVNRKHQNGRYIMMNLFTYGFEKNPPPEIE